MSGHNIDLPEGFEITDEIADHVHFLIEKCIQKYLNKERTVNQLRHEFNIDPSLTRTIWESLETANPGFFKWFATQCDVVSDPYQKLEVQLRDSTLSDGPISQQLPLVKSFFLKPPADFTASSSSGPETVPREPEVPKEESTEVRSRAQRAKEKKDKKQKAKKREKQLQNQVQLLLQAQEQLASSASPTTETAPDVQRLSSIGPQEEAALDYTEADDDTILEEISSTTRQLESIMKHVVRLLRNGPEPSRQKPSGSGAKTVPKQT